MQKISLKKAFWKAIDSNVVDLVDFMDDHYLGNESDGFIDYMADDTMLYSALIDPNHVERGFDTILFNRWLDSKIA